jgi:pantoate--beta-alanine ligase
MERFTTPEEARRALADSRVAGKTIALVPTMGALHEGHLSLVRAARARADIVVVSIFVNPLQFGPKEDFAAYPRDITRDLELLSAEGVDFVFTPTVDGMYPPGSETMVEPGIIATLWEGEVRPGHFTGMLTVVAKLFNIISPDLAFFGEKDYQQLVVVRRMAHDLDFAVTVVAVPTVREASGLAMSSRNAYLTPELRSAALVLSHTLREVAALIAEGERDAVALSRYMAEEIEGESLARLDYAVVVDPETLEPLQRLDAPARAIVAARFGTTRLIDNVHIAPPDTVRVTEIVGEAEWETSPA